MSRDLPYGLFLIRSPSEVEACVGHFSTYKKAVAALTASDITPHLLDLWLITFRDESIAFAYYRKNKLILRKKPLPRVVDDAMPNQYRWGWNVLYDIGPNEPFLNLITKLIPDSEKAAFLKPMVDRLLRDTAELTDPKDQDFVRVFLASRPHISSYIGEHFVDRYNRITRPVSSEYRNVIYAVTHYYRLLYAKNRPSDVTYYFINTLAYIHGDDEFTAINTVKSIIPFYEFMERIERAFMSA